MHVTITSRVYISSLVPRPSRSHANIIREIFYMHQKAGRSGNEAIHQYPFLLLIACIMILVISITKISFNETAMKQDMSAGFASLLNACPSVKSLKYVYTFNYSIAGYISRFLCILLTFSISKCALQVKTLTDINNGIRSDLMHSLTVLK